MTVRAFFDDRVNFEFLAIFVVVEILEIMT